MHKTFTPLRLTTTPGIRKVCITTSTHVRSIINWIKSIAIGVQQCFINLFIDPLDYMLNVIDAERGRPSLIQSAISFHVTYNFSVSERI